MTAEDCSQQPSGTRQAVQAQQKQQHHQRLRTYLSQALACSVPDWNNLSSSVSSAFRPESGCLKALVENTTALLLVRLIAIRDEQHQTSTKQFSDSSTTTICRNLLVVLQDTEDDGELEQRQDQLSLIDNFLTESVLVQLESFVQQISVLHASKLPFHNFEHAHAVVINANNLLEMVLTRDISTESGPQLKGRQPPAFGLRQDPLLALALLFAALVHDVDHTGVTNRQLVRDANPWALQYNDQSVQENRSLHVAFTELLKPEFDVLRSAMFPNRSVDYRVFRQTVIDLVLATDLASPMRMEISHSKWKEAFGASLAESSSSPYHRGSARRSSLASNISMPRAMPAAGKSPRQGSLTSAASDVSRPLASPTLRLFPVERRGSTSSILSDVTSDSFENQQRQRKVDHHNARHLQMQRSSNHSLESHYSDFANDSIALAGRGTKISAARKTPRRASASSLVSRDSSFGSEYAVDSVAVARQRNLVQENGYTTSSSEYQRSPPRNPPTRRASTGSSETLQSRQTRFSESTPKSNTVDSISLAFKRHQGGRITRQRPWLASQESSASTTEKGRPSTGFSSNIDEDFDNDSFTLTPPSSDDEDDGVVLSGALDVTLHDDTLRMFIVLFTLCCSLCAGITLSRSLDDNCTARDSPCGPPARRDMSAHRSSEIDDQRKVQVANRHPRVARRASTGNVPVKFGPLLGQRIDEEELGELSVRTYHGALYKGSAHRPQRLSIRRSMDFSGESLETYGRRPSSGRSSLDTAAYNDRGEAYDAPDALKSAVVLEVILRAADVGYFMQNWETLIEWSGRLYAEQEMAHLINRGRDPTATWFDNQLRVIQEYVLPLATRLRDIGVFGNTNGSNFACAVALNMDQWLVDGFEATKAFQLD